MKLIKTTLLVALCTTFSLAAFSQSEEDMKAWQAYMTPGAMHKMMESWNGTWEVETSIWAAPGADAYKTTFTTQTTTILGGRYSQTTYKGDFFGMPLDGILTIGYDNAKKEFFSTWIDNAGTGIIYSKGKYDEASKTIEFHGISTDGMTGKETKTRQVFVILDDNTHQETNYMELNGEEFKFMESKFVRKK